MMPSKVKINILLSLFLAITALFFNACQKENGIIENQNQITAQTLTPTLTSKLSVDDVRNWYNKTLSEEKKTLNWTNDSTILVDAEPQWSASKNSFSQNDEFLITPLTVKSDKNALFKLLTTRQADGSIKGKLVAYVPTQAYHEAKKGKYSVHDFTGAVIYTTLSGKFEYGFNIENGLYKGQTFATRSERLKLNTLKLRDCTTSTSTICIFFPYAIVLDCWYTVTISNTSCSENSSPTTAGTPGGLGGTTGGGGSAWSTNQPSNVFNQYSYNFNLGNVDAFVGMNPSYINSNTNEGKHAMQAWEKVRPYLNNMASKYFPNSATNAVTVQKFDAMILELKTLAGYEKLGEEYKSTFLSMKATIVDDGGNILKSFDHKDGGALAGEDIGSGFGQIDQHLPYGKFNTRAIGAFNLEIEDVTTSYKIIIDFSIVKIDGN